MAPSKIIWTHTDEAPALASKAWLPIFQAFTKGTGIEVETADISLAGRVIANFPDTLSEEQKIPDWRYDLFGMEYRHVARYLAGEIDRAQMIEDLVRDIMYLARRQETYFRGIQKRGLQVRIVERADLETAREIVRMSRFSKRS